MEAIIGTYIASALIVGAWYLIGEYLDAVLWERELAEMKREINYVNS